RDARGRGERRACGADLLQAVLVLSGRLSAQHDAAGSRDVGDGRFAVERRVCANCTCPIDRRYAVEWGTDELGAVLVILRIERSDGICEEASLALIGGVETSGFEAPQACMWLGW